MISGGPAGTVPAPVATEHELAAVVIDTLLREDYGGLSRRVRQRPGSPVLHLPAGHGAPGLALPLEPHGFLADLRIRRPAPPLTLDDIRSALDAVSDPGDRDGVAAFTAECRQALSALRLRERHLPAVRAALAPCDRAGAWLGAAGQLRYDALAATMPHPAYPTSPCRLGLSDSDSLRYAPEYLPEFELNWVAVHRSALVVAGRDRPVWWPAPADVGLPDSLAATHGLLPVHPLTARGELARALAQAGLAGAARGSRPGGREPAGTDRAVIAPATYLRVMPTLSTRTVAATCDPGSHLKLPLPMSTLGARNHRSIVPGTLADGALVRAAMATAASGDGLSGSLLLADEGSYAHAGHRYLGYLLRRLPAGLERCRIVPLAALLAPGTHAGSGGRPLVIEELAWRLCGGDLPGLVNAFLRLLFDIHVYLFVRYGIALEAHQQNAALVLGPDHADGVAGAPAPGVPGGPGRATLRLLVKDFDGTLINHARLASALGPAAPEPSAFTDTRLLTESDDALADVFITITLHLCAGALAFGLAERGVAPLPGLLAMVRRALAGALDRHAGSPPAALLRARVLDADRLPGKSMVTAGTLVAKSRTGARDINKFYGTAGPNYLKGGGQCGGT
jgi:hypothetical protein